MTNRKEREGRKDMEKVLPLRPLRRGKKEGCCA